MTQVMIDVTGANLPGLLKALQARYPGILAGYVTGTPDIDWHAADWTELAPHAGLFRIDQSPGLALFASGGADCADLERGAADLQEALRATQGREERGWWSWWYVQHNNDGPYGLSEARATAQQAGYKRVQYWLADWNMSLATAQAFLTANPDVSAVQWASPSSNPHTLVPGTQQTLAELNVDLSVARDGWFSPPRPPAPPRTLETAVLGFSDGSSMRF